MWALLCKSASTPGTCGLYLVDTGREGRRVEREMGILKILSVFKTMIIVRLNCIRRTEHGTSE